MRWVQAATTQEDARRLLARLGLAASAAGFIDDASTLSHAHLIGLGRASSNDGFGCPTRTSFSLFDLPWRPEVLRELGVHELLSKPLSYGTLATSLHRVLSR